jgi:hypothetical protein
VLPAMRETKNQHISWLDEFTETWLIRAPHPVNTKPEVALMRSAFLRPIFQICAQQPFQNFLIFQLSHPCEALLSFSVKCSLVGIF